MGDRVRVVLVCEVCSARNYHTTRAKKPAGEGRLALKKYCPACGTHTIHRESK